MKTADLVHPFRVRDGKGFRLKDFGPGDTLGFKGEDKKHAQEHLQKGVARLAELQDKLYAQDRWAVLLIFQAMDAAGKDGTIKHVMSGVNPQGCEVSAFKAPSAEELDHDFLWRAMKRIPERGRIGIFNRSYYEEVLVVRVHPELLAKQKLPPSLMDKHIWRRRFEEINTFERYLTNNGIVVLKFFLNVSHAEQKKRFLARLDDPSKNWKFSATDAVERKRWDDYMEAYEDMIQNTAAKHAPWYVVPADNKWFTRMVVAEAITEVLDGLDLKYPKVDASQRAELQAARKAIESE